MVDAKQMSVKSLFSEGFFYMKQNLKTMMIFSFVHILLLIIGFKIIGSWHKSLFLLWMVLYYLYGYFFFRFYFNRKPYLLTSKIFGTLAPSTRMLAIALSLLTVIFVLPIAPFFLKIDSPWIVSYANFFIEYIEDGKKLDIVPAVALILFSPIIFYRPMMAWIASVIGRSGLLRTAFKRTEGNYWQMLIIMIIFNTILVWLKFIGEILGIDWWLLIVFGSPLIVYFNVILAKTYELFFLDIE